MNKEWIFKNQNKLLVACSILLVLFTHFYMIGQVPKWLNADEAGIAYDAYCLSHYGVDRYGNSFPVFFINFGGGGQSPLYTYILAILTYFFGYSLVLLRVIIALASLVTGFFGYKLMKLRFKDLEAPVYLLLFSIMPIFTIYFRTGMDCALMLPTGTMFLYFLSKAVLSEKTKDYLFAGLSGGLVLYTYTLSYIVMPIMLLLTFFYLLKVCSGKCKTLWINWIIMAIPLGIMAAPLFCVQIINMKQLPTLHLGIFTFPCLPWYRGSELSFDGFFTQLAYAFRYTVCSDYLYYTAIPKFGNFYYISVPFIVLGFIYAAYRLVRSFSDNSLDVLFIPVLWALSEFLLAGIMSVDTPPHASRLNGILSILLYFLVVGLFCVYHFLSKYRKRYSFSGIFAILMIGCYAISFIAFGNYYFHHFNDYLRDSKMHFFSAELDPVVDYLNNDGAKYATTTTYIDDYGQYIFYMLARRMNPYDMSSDIMQTTEAQRYENFYFYFPNPLDLKANYASKNPIPELLPFGFKELMLGEYYFYVSPVADLNLADYQVKDTAYLIESLTAGNTGVILSGWCLDTSVGIEIDGNYYPAEHVSRPDVAEAFQVTENLNYGFLCTIPFEKISSNQEIYLVRILQDGTSERLVKIYR